MTIASVGQSDLPACDPAASFSVHLAINAVNPTRYAHKSRGDNVGAVEEMMCVMSVSATKEE